MSEELRSFISQAEKQQQLTGKADAAVSFFIRGGWANGKRRLRGRSGPLGKCVAEFENEVLVVFKADEVIDYASRLLPPE